MEQAGGRCREQVPPSERSAERGVSAISARTFISVMPAQAIGGVRKPSPKALLGRHRRVGVIKLDGPAAGGWRSFSQRQRAGSDQVLQPSPQFRRRW